MTWSLLCTFPERFAAASPMSASMTEAQIASSKPQRAVPIVMFAGTADKLVRYDGALPGNAHRLDPGDARVLAAAAWLQEPIGDGCPAS